MDRPRRVTLPRPRSDLHWQVMGDELVVVDPASGSLHALNEVARLIFEELGRPGGVTLRDLGAAVASRYETTPKQATADAAAFVEQLAGRGLLDGDT